MIFTLILKNNKDKRLVSYNPKLFLHFGKENYKFVKLQKSQTMKTELIHKITNIKVQVHENNPPVLHLLVLGTTDSGNHINPRLARRKYIDFPKNGIQEYDLFIEVSDEQSSDQFKSYGVEDEWYDFPEELIGIKVYGRTNEMEKMVKIEGRGVSSF